MQAHAIYLISRVYLIWILQNSSKIEGIDIIEIIILPIEKPLRNRNYK